jgi:hypothetical protein
MLMIGENAAHVDESYFVGLQISDVLTLKEKFQNKQTTVHSGIFKATFRNTQLCFKNLCFPEILAIFLPFVLY